MLGVSIAVVDIALPNLQINFHQSITRQGMESIMPELMSSPPILIIAAILAIFLIIAIIKHAWHLFIWIVIIFAILIYLGVMKQSDLLQWFENLRKMVE